jgi:hypothetical protein
VLRHDVVAVELAHPDQEWRCWIEGDYGLGLWHQPQGSGSNFAIVHLVEVDQVAVLVKACLGAN